MHRARARPRLSSSCVLVCAALACVMPRSAPAQGAETPIDPLEPIQFKVEVDAPRPYERILEEGLDIVRWQGEQRVTYPLLERLVEDARKAAAEALAAYGYFSANVRSEIDLKGPAEALVRLAVELGPRTEVRSVDLDFAGAAVNDPEGRERIEAVRQNWSLVPGEPFTQQRWNSAKDSALARLARGRYAAAKITDSEARVDPAESSAALSLKFDSGPIFHAGPTRVSGLKRYPESVVKNMNPFKPGEPYDALKLDLYQRRLIETGYFNAAHFSIDPDPDQSAAAPLNVKVIEAPSQRVETGIEYNTDTGPGLTVDYGNADVFDSAWRFRSTLKLNEKEQGSSVSLDTPPRPGGVWQTYSARVERTDIENQITREAVVGVAHNWGLERLPSQVSLSAHFERQKITASTTENSHALFAAYRKTFRTTEELVAPREGLIGTFEIGASIPGLSSQEFARVRTRVNWLIPAGTRNDFLLRGELGYVLADTRDGIPSSFLFRTGGDQTIRGYAYQSIGVLQGKAIVGGRYLALASAEYTRWVTETLGAAVFVDAGDAFDEFDRFRLAVGVGVGVRWKSPIGPFRADVAYGERTDRIRLHFSVGYSF